MPVFYFDIHDSQGDHHDEIGIELANLEAAIEEARRTIADMSREALVEGPSQKLEITVRDHLEGPVRLVVSITSHQLGDGDA